MCNRNIKPGLKVLLRRYHYTGKNLKSIEDLSGIDPWVFGSGRVKQELVKAELVEVPQQDQWRVGYLARLLEERQMLHYGGDMGKG